MKMPDSRRLTQEPRVDNFNVMQSCPKNYCRRYYDSHMLHWHNNLGSSRVTSSSSHLPLIGSAGQAVNIINIPMDSVLQTLSNYKRCHVGQVTRSLSRRDPAPTPADDDWRHQSCQSTSHDFRKFTPSAKSRLSTALRSGARHESSSPKKSQTPMMASRWSTRQMSQLLFDSSLPTEKRYQKYVSHVSSLDECGQAEMAMIGGFRLINGYHKPSINLPRISMAGHRN